MAFHEISGTYNQSGDQERFRGELALDENQIIGQIDDIDQGMVVNPQKSELRNKVVEGEAYPENSAVYFVRRPFQSALNNLDRSEKDRIDPQEVHVIAETSTPGIEGEYTGIWTLNGPEELPVEYLGDEDFELRWNIEPWRYDRPDMSAEEVIDILYDGDLPENPEDINTKQEISRGTTEFRLNEVEDQERAEEGPPIDTINAALNGGVEDQRRIT